MNRLEELAGAATHVAEQSWGVSDATQTAMREIAAILLAASKVDVAGLMTIVERFGSANFDEAWDRRGDKDSAESEAAVTSLRQQIETALRMALAGREWQPIETAPKDGTSVLLHTAEGVIEGYYQYGDWEQSVCGANYDMAQAYISCKPTHWMPLPAAPKGEQT